MKNKDTVRHVKNKRNNRAQSQTLEETNYTTCEGESGLYILMKGP